MGFLKAFASAVGRVLADQWVDYFKADALPMQVLAVKGYRFVPGGSNTKFNENVITDGSRMDVADGQCLLIVENGKIVDFCAEPGQYIYKTDLQPSLLSGGLEGLGKSFQEVGKRFTGGGQTLSSQRVYYINTKELMGNKWGIGQVPFRDSEFQFTIKLSAYGEYSYRITNPLLFYVNVCGNLEGAFTRDRIDSQLKAELQSALQPALGRVALKQIPYDQLPLYTLDLCEELNKELTASWVEKRGISVSSMAMASVAPDAESAQKIAQFQESRVFTDGRMMGARIGAAQATAMESAASNQGGAMAGFIGLGLAQQAGGIDANALFRGAPPPDPASAATAAPSPLPPTSAAPAETETRGWVCGNCGHTAEGNFCSHCGNRQPKAADTFSCSCGWSVEHPAQPPKFCPNCGKRIEPA